LNWEFIRDQELADVNDATTLKPDLFALRDFFLAMNGSNGRFIYDPAANVIPLEDTFVTQVTSGTLVNGQSGTTAGSETVFQLYRTSNVTGASIPVEAIDALSSISGVSGSNPFHLYLNGSPVSPSLYTLSQYPLQVTFHTAPTPGQIISWLGNYAYVAKFLDDTLDFNQFVEFLYELQSCKLEQVPLGF
jgi:hypothetical protein